MIELKKERAAKKPKRGAVKRAVTCKTCGGKGHIAKTCPSTASA